MPSTTNTLAVGNAPYRAARGAKNASTSRHFPPASSKAHTSPETQPDSDGGKNERRAHPSDNVQNALHGLPAPAFAVHRPHGQEQAEADEAQVVNEVLGVEHAAREVVQVLDDRQVVEDVLR